MDGNSTSTAAPAASRLSGIRDHWLLWASLLVATAAYLFFSQDKRRKHLPPGPRGLPILGNLLSLTEPDKVPLITRGWVKKYGRIFYTRMGEADWIWLNDSKAVSDLLDKRGAKYSSRPPMPMFMDAGSNGNRQPFMPYNEKWRKVRKLSHAALNANAIASYKPVQDLESKQVLFDTLHAKDDTAVYDINRRYSTSVIMTVAYGHRVPDWSDPWIQKIFQIMEHATIMAEPGKWLVDVFPSLAKLPPWMVQNWWAIGRKWFEWDREVFISLYRDIIQKYNEGTAPNCFVRDFYASDPESQGIDEEVAAYTAGTLIEGGSETTSTMLNVWVLACQIYPDPVKVAQAELDRVVGSDRLPSFEDRENLPYISAMVEETLRWWPITKVGFFHAATEDDWYDGYFIPKNAVLVLNWWTIQFDESKWTDPTTWDPSRFIVDGKFSTELAQHTFPFGVGRRLCQGETLARNSLFINTARVLWAFNIKRAIGPDGKEIQPEIKAEPGLINVPHKYSSILEPRSKKHAQIVEEEWERAKKVNGVE